MLHPRGHGADAALTQSVDQRGGPVVPDPCPFPVSLPLAKHKAPTWHHDARRQAFQHSPQGLAGTHRPIGRADGLFTQELQGLQGKRDNE